MDDRLQAATAPPAISAHNIRMDVRFIVPVSFAEISPAAVLSEIAEMRADLVPEISLGTHFFNDIVENQTLYLAVFPDREDTVLNRSFLDESPNRLAELLPEEARWEEAVRVIEPSALGGGVKLCVNANALEQRAICYLTKDA